MYLILVSVLGLISISSAASISHSTVPKLPTSPTKMDQITSSAALSHASITHHTSIGSKPTRPLKAMNQNTQSPAQYNFAPKLSATPTKMDQVPSSTALSHASITHHSSIASKPSTSLKAMDQNSQYNFKYPAVKLSATLTKIDQIPSSATMSHASVTHHSSSMSQPSPPSKAMDQNTQTPTQSNFKYPVPKILGSSRTMDQDTPANYDFEYVVHDPNTGDIKEQRESRQGDVVHGMYSLIEPDGSRRIVEYTADNQNGFQAIVHREPAVHPTVNGAIVPVAAVASIPKIAAVPFAKPFVNYIPYTAPSYKYYH